MLSGMLSTKMVRIVPMDFSSAYAEHGVRYTFIVVLTCNIANVILAMVCSHAMRLSEITKRDLDLNR